MKHPKSYLLSIMLILAPVRLLGLSLVVEIDLALASKEIAYNIAKAANFIPAAKADRLVLLKLQQIDPDFQNMIVEDLRNFLSFRTARYSFVYDKCVIHNNQAVLVPHNQEELLKLHRDTEAFIYAQPWYQKVRLNTVDEGHPYMPKVVLLHRQLPSPQELATINEALKKLIAEDKDGVLEAQFADVSFHFSEP
ncbi:MAG: hypothetical protein ACK5O7_00410 [Holosporales bacterium]